MDPLTEDSLSRAGVGLRSRHILIGRIHTPEVISASLRELAARGQRLLLKLHGDASWGNFVFTDEEMLSLMTPGLEHEVRTLLQNGITVIGHRMADPDIQRCLRSGKYSEPLYYVDVNNLSPFLQDNRGNFEAIALISNTDSSSELGDFDNFLGRLHQEVFPNLYTGRTGTVLFHDDFTNDDLAGLQFLWGSYGIRNGAAWIGSAHQDVGNVTTAVVPHIIAPNLHVNLQLQLDDDGNEASNWLGLMLRGSQPAWPDNCFVYFRSNGNVDVMNRLGDVEVLQSGVNWKKANHPVQITLSGDQLSVVVENNLIAEIAVREAPVRPGRVYLHAYRSRWLIRELSLALPT